MPLLSAGLVNSLCGCPGSLLTQDKFRRPRELTVWPSVQARTAGPGESQAGTQWPVLPALQTRSWPHTAVPSRQHLSASCDNASYEVGHMPLEALSRAGVGVMSYLARDDLVLRLSPIFTFSAVQKI